MALFQDARRKSSMSFLPKKHVKTRMPTNRFIDTMKILFLGNENF
jgi:hypothetical protein